MGVEPNKDRAEALDRALRMAVLFRLENFDKVMQAVRKNARDPMTAKKEFDAALDSAGLNNQLQKEWLWNYLKEYSEDKCKWACPGYGW